MVERILPLSIKHSTVKKHGKRIIGPIDIDISEDGFTIIMGPNGSGKTTLLRLLHGLERSRGGEINWNTDLETARLNQSYVFQTPILLRRTAVENIMYPLLLRGITKEEASQNAKEWIARIKLDTSANLNAKLLSGGEKQKLALARALATKPQLLILDEPTANLDGTATKEIESLLQETRRSGTRIIMTTHDLGQAKRLAEDVVFLYQGNIHERGEAKNFFKSPTTNEAKVFTAGEILE